MIGGPQRVQLHGLGGARVVMRHLPAEPVEEHRHVLGQVRGGARAGERALQAREPLGQLPGAVRRFCIAAGGEERRQLRRREDPRVVLYVAVVGAHHRQRQQQVGDRAHASRLLRVQHGRAAHGRRRQVLLQDAPQLVGLLVVAAQEDARAVARLASCSGGGGVGLAGLLDADPHLLGVPATLGREDDVGEERQQVVDVQVVHEPLRAGCGRTARVAVRVAGGAGVAERRDRLDGGLLEPAVPQLGAHGASVQAGLQEQAGELGEPLSLHAGSTRASKGRAQLCDRA